MRKLNSKNKFFIVIFALVVILIAGIITVSVYMTTQNQSTTDFEVSDTYVLFDSETNLVDTTGGGRIGVKLGEYIYSGNDGRTSELGMHPVIYDRTTEEIDIFGTNYQIDENGNVTKNDVLTKVAKSAVPTFYKLDDRVYLVIAEEIYNTDKSIYSSRYMIVYIDKQGNASVLNDSLNVKTINPMSLKFDEYTFDVANEKLMTTTKTVDLKLVNGSTNEYVAKVDDSNSDESIMADSMAELITSYNDLVEDFVRYSNAANINVSASNQITYNFIVTNGANNSNSGNTVKNNVEIARRVSLRGAIAYPTAIDITYLVTDPEEKYQVVYVLVTGTINGVYQTEKIMLDKYGTTYRIAGLSPRQEYSISLGYMEVSYDNDGDKVLTDVIDDVINVRTTRNDMSLTVEKIAGGYVYFNFKMSDKFAVTYGEISLYGDSTKQGYVVVDTVAARTEAGYSGKIAMGNAGVYKLALENAIYNGSSIDIGLTRKFYVVSP